MNYKLKLIILLCILLASALFGSTNSYSLFRAYPNVCEVEQNLHPTASTETPANQNFLDQQLYDATARNDTLQVTYWLNRGANPNAKVGPHQTGALHCASQHNYLEVAKFLVQNGANIRIKNDRGLTPIQYAWFYRSNEVLDFLQRTLRTTAATITIAGLISV